MTDNMYHFDLPTSNQSIIKVVGVGGGGSNAVNYMYSKGIKDVEFIVCNTDKQALDSSPVSTKLQIGLSSTNGLGAGGNPEKGKNAAIESKDDIERLLSKDTKMLFITAGMGGGTGTGAAPVIAEVASELDILTVGIVTKPFAFEGKKKMQAAEKGIDEFRKYCDTVIVIMNEKLREMYGSLSISEAFANADDILTTAAKGIAEIITVPGHINVDFEDVKTVMKKAGTAVMGSAKAEGENRARRAIEEALNSPLLNQRQINGAEKILLSIRSGEKAELQMNELDDISSYMRDYASSEAEVIFGHGMDSQLGEKICVTVIATGGFGKNNDEVKSEEKTREVTHIDLESQKVITQTTAPHEEHQPVKPVMRIEPFQEQEMEPLKDDKYESRINQEEEQEREKHVETFTSEEWDEAVSQYKEEFEEEFMEEEEALKKTEHTSTQGTLPFNYVSESEEHNEEDNEEYSQVDIADAFEHKEESLQIRFARERKEREDKFLDNKVAEKKHEITQEEFKKLHEVPAFKRKNVKFLNIQYSSESNLSKTYLSEDNKIVAKNKFLHDNVD